MPSVIQVGVDLSNPISSNQLNSVGAYIFKICHVAVDLAMLDVESSTAASYQGPSAQLMQPFDWLMCIRMMMVKLGLIEGNPLLALFLFRWKT